MVMSWHSYLFWLYSWVSALPWACVIYYRYCYQADYSVYVKKYPQADRLDKYILALTTPYGIYYLCDTVFILFYLPSVSACGWSYFCHHIVSLVATPIVITMPHYPWFIMLPYAWHCLLLMFPGVFFLNVVYICIIFIKIREMHKVPWSLYSHYRVYRLVVYSMLVGPLVMLWYNQCTNNMSNHLVAQA